MHRFLLKIVSMLTQRIPEFMEPEGSLPYNESPPLLLFLNQLNLVHTFLRYFSNIYSSIILLSPYSSPK
jgi:hypothetical protein